MKKVIIFIVLLLFIFTTNVASYGANTENYKSPLGTNLSPFNYWMSDWVFVDAFSKSRSWVSSLCSGGWDNGPAMSKDSYGWVTTLSNDQCVETLIFKDMGGHYPSGQYVILWEGDGTFIIFGDTDSVFMSQWAATTTTNGIKRSTFTVQNPTNSGLDLKITSLTASYLKNFRVIMPGGVCGTSTSNLDYFAYCQSSRGGSGSCSSGQTCYDFEQIYWDRFVDSTSTMNNPKVVFHPAFLSKLKKYRAIRYMTWAAITNSSVQNWSDRANINQQTYADFNWTAGQQGKGMPYEFITSLSNMLNTDVWLNIPAKSTDSYNNQLATFMKDNLLSNLKIYVEYSNEVFSTDYSDDRSYMISKATELGITNDNPFVAGTYLTDGYKIARYYSKRAGEIHSIWRNVFSDQSNRIIRVLATFLIDYAYTQEVLDYNNAYQNADVLATGGYFMGTLYRTEYENTILTMTVDNMFDEINNGGVVAQASQSALAEINDSYTHQYSLANPRGLRLVAYEGGQHLVATRFTGDYDNEEDGDNQNVIYNKFLAVNRDSRMKSAYITNFTNFKNAGGHEFLHFNNGDYVNIYGIFGALEYQTQDRNAAPKYDGIMTFIEQNDCWWTSCDRSITTTKATPALNLFWIFVFLSISSALLLLALRRLKIKL
ncbi:MAG: hypothetical protein L3V56_02640 [Candidatus Magnetoovum sp. WYHC-5]|nr:hypothetical protein [Candidatus Magnetoovum sp. WYHC-5]